MRFVAFLVALVVALAGAATGLVLAVGRFNNHQGLPWHISIGTQYGHVSLGQSGVISGTVYGGRRNQKLVLWAETAPYLHHDFHPIATLDHIGPHGSYRFVVWPRVRSRYQVATAIDRQDSSRMVAIIVDPPVPVPAARPHR